MYSTGAFTAPAPTLFPQLTKLGSTLHGALETPGLPNITIAAEKRGAPGITVMYSMHVGKP